MDGAKVNYRYFGHIQKDVVVSGCTSCAEGLV